MYIAPDDPLFEDGNHVLIDAIRGEVNREMAKAIVLSTNFCTIEKENICLLQIYAYQKVVNGAWFSTPTDYKAARPEVTIISLC